MTNMTIWIFWCVQVFTSAVNAQAMPFPVGFWRLDDLTKGTDLSGNDNNMTLYGVEWTDGPHGGRQKAVSFTGADDFSSRAEIPNTNRVLSVRRSFTWMTYHKPENDDAGPLFCMGHWGHIFWNLQYGRFHPRYDGSSFMMALTTENYFFPIGEWTHVAVTYDFEAGVIRIFRNGEERIDLRRDYSQELNDDYDVAHVAAHPGDGRQLNGGLYCLMYFGDSLSVDQISAARSLCNSGAGYYRKHPLVADGMSITSPDRTVVSHNHLSCMNECTQLVTCLSIGYDNDAKTCDLSFGNRQLLNSSSYSQTRKQYLEKFFNNNMLV